MLKDKNMGVPMLSPRKTADSAKRRNTPPPLVARKPVGLMERITMEKKSGQSGNTHTHTHTHTTYKHQLPMFASHIHSTHAFAYLCLSPAKAHPKSTAHTKTTTSTVLSKVTKTTPPPQPSPSKGTSTALTNSTPSHPTPEASEGLGSGVNSHEEATATPSQNKPQQLRVRTFKLDNLAHESVGVASQVSSVRTSAQLHREGLIKPQVQSGALVPGDGGAGDSVSVRGVRELVSGEIGELGSVKSKERAGVVGEGHTRDLELESDREGSDTDVEMEPSPGYDRLRLGHGNTRGQNGSVKYDHLASKHTQDNGFTSDRTSDENGRSFAEVGVATEDKGQSYYIGGRGRKRESELEAPESPVTPHQDHSEENNEGLRGKLMFLAKQLQNNIHAIAERERCSLRSLELEMHSGEVKVLYIQMYCVLCIVLYMYTYACMHVLLCICW